MPKRDLKRYIIIVKSKHVLDSVINDVMGRGAQIHIRFHRNPYGFSASLTGLLVKILEQDKRITHIEEAVQASLCDVQLDAPLHLDRIDQHTFPLSDTFRYTTDGADIPVYVVDSGGVFRDADSYGILHEEFKDGPNYRLEPVLDRNPFSPDVNTVFDPFYPGKPRIEGEVPPGGGFFHELPRGFDELVVADGTSGASNETTLTSFDGNTTKFNCKFTDLTVESSSGQVGGHGTHVAGLIAGKTYGVAKKAIIKSVKAFSALYPRDTTTDVIIDALNAVLDDYDLSGRLSAICNFSWRFIGTVPIVETKIQEMIARGITIFAAAGNDGIEASSITPARMPEVITVGATSFDDDRDYFSSFSNYGPVVDILAPGALRSVGRKTEFGLVSSSQISPNAVSRKKGTSMSTPLAAGVGALLVKEAEFLNQTLNPSEVKQNILQNATNGVISYDQYDFDPSLKLEIQTTTTNKILFSTHVDYTIEWLTPSGLLKEVTEGFTITSVQVEALAYDNNFVTYSLLSGMLPPGATLNPSTGMITGTAPIVTSDTDYNFTIRAQSGSHFDDRAFSIRVLDGQLPPNWLTANDIGSFEEGVELSIQFVATSRNPDAPTITYSPVSTLPSGWTLSSSGLLEGVTPTIVNFSDPIEFTLRADDGVTFSDRTFRLLITQVRRFPPMWQTEAGSLGSAIEGELFSQQVYAIDPDVDPLPLSYHTIYVSGDGSTFGPYGELPPGMGLDPDTGEITGIFTGDFTNATEKFYTTFDGMTTTFDSNTMTNDLTRGIFQFTVFVTDGAYVVGRTFSIEATSIDINLLPKWITPSTTLATIPALAPATIQLDAYDPDMSPSDLEFTISGGVLPPGMSLNTVSGIISGTPLNVIEDTDFAFVVGVSDGQDSVQRTFVIRVKRVNESPKWQTPVGVLGTFNENQAISILLTATDNNDDLLRYTVIDNTPSGTTLDASTTSFDSGATTFADIVGNPSELPSSLTLNENTGLITGQLDEVDATTTYNFTVRVDDSRSNSVSETLFADRNFSITVLDDTIALGNEAPEWVTPAGSIPDVTEGEHYYFQFDAVDSDGIPGPLTYVMIAGSLPDGLALNAQTGVLSGYSFDDNLTDDNFVFTIRVSDGALFADRTFNATVIDAAASNLPPVWVTPAGSLGSYDELTPLVVAIEATDPEGENVFYTDVSSFPNSLPPGMAITSTGIITGTLGQVLADTTFIFDIQATDESGASSIQTFSITVENVPNIPPFWVTPAGLLGDYNEDTSVVVALNAIDPDVSPQALSYNVSSGTLPAGLSLNSGTGIISGLLSDVPSDTLYTFDVTVDDGAAFVARTFQIQVRHVPTAPDERSDLSVALTGPPRREWKTWNTSALIDDEDIYEINNPLYGRNLFPEIFVKGDLHTINPTEVYNAFGAHHHTFDVLIGALSSAVVRNEITGEVEYEMIYLPIIDGQKGSDFNIVNTNVPSSYDTNGAETYVSYNFDHLRTELDAIPNSETLPEWMTSEQTEGDSTSALGYIPAFEVAAVKPGTSASIIERVNEITVIEISLPSNETTFDQSRIYGVELDPTINTYTELGFNNGEGFSYSLVLDGGTIPLTVYDIVSVINGDTTLNGQGITASVEEFEIFDTGTSTFSSGDVIVINYPTNQLIFSDDAGTPKALLGLPNVAQQTIFDGDTTTFDLIPGTEIRIEKSIGLQFTGRKITIDRYLFENNAESFGPGTSFTDPSGMTIFDTGNLTFDVQVSTSRWIKFNSDSPRPIWLNNPGFLYNFADGETASITLETESPIKYAGSGIPRPPVTYRLVFGSFPSWLNFADLSNGVSMTGTLTGTAPDPVPFEIYHFVIRAEDNEGNFSDRGFFITVSAPTTFDTDMTTFDGDMMTLDAS